MQIAIVIVLIFFLFIIKNNIFYHNYKYQLFSIITDSGEVINKVIINYPKNMLPIEITSNSYTVNAKSYIQAGEQKGKLLYNINRNIVKTETKNNQVILYLLESEGFTLTFLEDKQRNYPAKLKYTITQNTPIKTSTNKIIKNAIYTWDKKIINNELSKFKFIKDSINYQFYDAGISDKLIIWFHGNGDGGFDNFTDNTVHIRANRGAVAWTSETAQKIFNKAHVAAFQVLDTWFYAEKDNLLEIVYNEIRKISDTYNINKIIVSGCSAGGYMSTRMLIKYPDLFAAAIIICPALDVANIKGGRTPTAEEL